jgi:hypothetical protein
MQENSTLKYVFVTKSQCPNVQKECAGRQVIGTLHVHAVIRLSVWGINVKDTTVSTMHVSQIVKWNQFVRDGKFTAVK